MDSLMRLGRNRGLASCTGGVTFLFQKVSQACKEGARLQRGNVPPCCCCTPPVISKPGAASQSKSVTKVKLAQKHIQNFVKRICAIFLFAAYISWILLLFVLKKKKKSYCWSNLDTASCLCSHRQRNFTHTSCPPTVKKTDHRLTSQCRALITIRPNACLPTQGRIVIF